MRIIPFIPFLLHKGSTTAAKLCSWNMIFKVLHRHMKRSFKIHPTTMKAAFHAPTAPVPQCLRQNNQFCLLSGFALEKMRK